MRKIMFYGAAVFLTASLTACNGGKTQSAKTTNSTSVADTAQTAAPFAGTYTGTLPSADCPGIETTLTVREDSTYDLVSHYIGQKDTIRISGVYHMLDGKVLQLIRPSTEEMTYYKIKDAKSVVMTDSLGNEPEGEMAKLYVLKKK